MAHKQADRERQESADSYSGKSATSGGKGRLNRRKFVKGGAAVSAVLLGTAPRLTASSGTDESVTFTTNFGEYVQ